MWQPGTENGVTLWQVQAWCDIEWLKHGFTTRDCGNLALHIGDDQQQVIVRRQKISRFFGVELSHWVSGNQVHQTKITSVTTDLRGSGATTQATALGETDGLITIEPGILLASFYADCVPLLFIVPKHKLIASAHAGWRGTAGNIAMKMIEKLQHDYLIKPSDVEVAIGPAIGSCCYQAGSQVANAFSADVITVNENGVYLDLWQANRIQLLEMGVPDAQIFVAKKCTCCDPGFFSYRREGDKAGRMAALLYINH